MDWCTITSIPVMFWVGGFLFFFLVVFSVYKKAFFSSHVFFIFMNRFFPFFSYMFSPFTVLLGWDWVES